MKLVCISDTHMQHRDMELPEGDILIHAGDFSNRGHVVEITDFIEWFSNTPYSHQILIAGNHDIGTEKESAVFKLMCSAAGIHYLCDSEIIINGIKFYGSPVTPTFGWGWAWNRDRGEEIKKHWDAIPLDTDVLITHGPPAGILDSVPQWNGGMEQVGCKDLNKRIWDINPKVHIFGHIHCHSGVYIMPNKTTFINAAIVNERHKIVNKAKVVEIDGKN